MECLSKTELLVLLAAAKATKQRDWLMILVSYNHGLRASETIAITRDALKDGYLTVKRLKGSNRTVQPLLTNVNPLLDERTALLEYAAKSNGNQRLFPVTRRTFYNIVSRHAKTAGIPAHLAHPHILKHTIAMQTIKSAGIENVKAYLGHVSLNSTGAYLKVNDAEASAAIREATK